MKLRVITHTELVYFSHANSVLMIWTAATFVIMTMLYICPELVPCWLLHMCLLTTLVLRRQPPCSIGSLRFA